MGGSPEYTIYKTLFADYNKNVRPETTSAIDVVVALRFLTLLFLEQKEELMVFTADFELTWTDPSLRWDASSYSDQTVIHVPESYVWKPDVTVYNSVGQQDVIDAGRRVISIWDDGTVLLSNPAVYTTRCRLNVNRFPFDTQTCSIKLSSWVYTIDELTMQAPESALNFSQPEYKGNSEWDITEVTRQVIETTDVTGEKFKELEYKIILERRSSYYIYVLLVPTFIVSTLSLIGLFTPFDNQGNRVERVTLGLTTLLSLAVMLNIVGNDMPKSTKLPQLGSFVLAEIILCSIGVLVTIVLQLAHQRVLTRRILPMGNSNKQQFDGTREGKMGIRVLTSADGSLQASLGQLEQTLQEIVYHIDRLDTRERFRLHWVKIFDTWDLIFLVLFQTINIIMTLCFLLIR